MKRLLGAFDRYVTKIHAPTLANFRRGYATSKDNERSPTGMAANAERYAGYTLVLDDNWPSRRTAERLGARVTGNFVTYRRNL